MTPFPASNRDRGEFEAGRASRRDYDVPRPGTYSVRQTMSDEEIRRTIRELFHCPDERKEDDDAGSEQEA